MSANPQRTNTPKNVAVYFKDVNTEETLSSQDQKLVETTNLWRQILSDKDHHSKNPLPQQSLNQQNRWLEQQWTHQDFLTSHTVSCKMKKNCTTRDRIKDKHKKSHNSKIWRPKLKI